MTKVHNFSAGPAILPKSAIEESIEGLRNFKNTGLSVVEISHRSPEWEEVMDDSVRLVKELLNFPDGYSVLFLQGGASTQFLMVPYNLLPTGKKAAYINTGSWSKKAIKEAKLFGEVDVVVSSEDKNFSYIPKDFNIPNDIEYFHFTANNTIFGTQFTKFPDADCPIITDMSSEMFSRPFDPGKMSLIYAGAQKNMGPAGATLVIVKDEILGKSGRTLPSMMDYNVHISKGSMFNTPPVFSIYLSYLTMKWIKAEGGLAEMERRNKEKAEILYKEIDENPLFEGTAAKEDRSLMNITFVATKPELEGKFLEKAKSANIYGIKGHRSVGGFRASCYNALAKESVEALVDVMQDFAKKNS